MREETAQQAAGPRGSTLVAWPQAKMEEGEQQTMEEEEAQQRTQEACQQAKRQEEPGPRWEEPRRSRSSC